MTTRRQCAKCPWRVDVDPRDIPNGYCESAHRDLRTTIADATDVVGQYVALGDRTLLRLMACHETDVGCEKPCVGWLHNQLYRGNNLRLRLLAFSKPEILDYELVGEQHDTFDDTLGGES